MYKPGSASHFHPIFTLDHIGELHKPNPDECDHCAELALIDAIRDFAHAAAQYVKGSKS